METATGRHVDRVEHGDDRQGHRGGRDRPTEDLPDAEAVSDEPRADRAAGDEDGSAGGEHLHALLCHGPTLGLRQVDDQGRRSRPDRVAGLGRGRVPARAAGSGRARTNVPEHADLRPGPARRAARTVGTMTSEVAVAAPPATELVLRDGRTARLRLAAADDRPGLRRLDAGLSPRSRWLRYSSVGPGAGTGYVAAVADGTPGGASLVVEIDGRVVAVGSFFGLPTDPGVAEVALLVDDDHQANGLGTLLLEHLAAIAANTGVTTFVAEVATVNATMLDVLGHSGRPLRLRSSAGTTRAELSLSPGGHRWDVVPALDALTARASAHPAPVGGT